MHRAAEILDFVRAAQEAAERVALVTLTRVIGSASRSVGTQMAVRESGAFAGSMSSGCVEAAIVAEAQRVLQGGRAALVRFGAGSPYMDIRLPCGGGMELLFTPDPDRVVIASVCQILAGRRAAALGLGRDGSVIELAPGPSAGWCGGRFHLSYSPPLRVLILGRGAETRALALQARAYGASPTVLSPDAELVARLAEEGVDSRLLTTPAASPDLRADAHTAILFLFHDHDWEPALLAQALRTPAFLVGAMGSTQTHERRCFELLRRGVDESAIARLRGPVGLIAAARDPDTLALSALAEVVQEYRRTEPASSWKAPALMEQE